MTIPNSAIQPPHRISRLIGDDTAARNTALQFFETVHSYMPIISKKLFFDRLLNPLGVPGADVALLCLCMKLMTWSPSHSERKAQTDVYISAKQYFVELEVAGIFTIRVLQSGLLIALYELGHGIYPSVYLTISTCVAYALAMKLESGLTSKMTSQVTWVEQEEQRRVWWATVILERSVIQSSFKVLESADKFPSIGNLGWPGRPLATPDPTLYDLLPAEDEAWNKGVCDSTLELFNVLSINVAVIGEKSSDQFINDFRHQHRKICSLSTCDSSTQFSFSTRYRAIQIAFHTGRGREAT